MPMPSLSAYQAALQWPDLAFADPRLARGTVATNALGLPQAITGAFAAVFRVETDAGSRAVRCFTTDDPHREARYRTLRQALEASKLDCFVGFEWQSKGVVVEGEAVPILVMDWADGVPLDQFLDTHHGDAERVRALAEAWSRLLADLDAAGITHGDLQHGNVLVAEDEHARPRLTLVDYDAMAVAGTRMRPASEVGHRNYQHPDRTQDDTGAAVDRFAGLVVATALAALLDDPTRWTRYGTGENALFVAEDFVEPEASPLFAELEASSNPEVTTLAGALKDASYRAPSQTPTLDQVRSGGSQPATQRVRRPRFGEAGRSMRRRSWVERAFVPATLGLAAAMTVLGLALGLSVAGWLLAGVLLCVAWGGAALYAWQQRPEVRRTRRLARERAALDRWIRDLDQQARLLRERLSADLDDREARIAARLEELQREALHRALRQHFVGELDTVEGVGHRAVVRLKAAGVRDAAMATPEAVARITRLSPESQVRIRQWRQVLAQRYANRVPRGLPPSEQHRLARVVERERAEAESEIRRVEAKRAAQAAEREAVVRRQTAEPSPTLGAYLAWLLYLRARPVAPPTSSTTVPARVRAR